MGDLYAHPTVRGQAALIESGTGGPAAVRSPGGEVAGCDVHDVACRIDELVVAVSAKSDLAACVNPALVTILPAGAARRSPAGRPSNAALTPSRSPVRRAEPVGPR